jgi:uncharacterized protein
MTSVTDLRKFKNVLAIKKGEEVWGFHTENLQVARLDHEAWSALGGEVLETESEALLEINDWSATHDSDVTSATSEQKITSYAVNISQVCNLKCTYCAAGGDGSYGEKKGKVELSKVLPQLQMFLSKLSDGESFRIHFIGGEPLLHPDAIESIANFAKLYVAGRSIDLQFIITTNGTLINAKVAGLLAKLRAHVTVSFDGDSKENDAVRPQTSGKPSTSLVLAGLSELKKVRSELSSLSVNGVFGDHNLQIKKAHEFYRDFDFDAININYSVQGQDSNELSQAYVREVTGAFDAVSGSETELTRFSFLKQTFRTLDEQTRVLNHCGAGKSLIHADASAKAFTCAWLINDKDEQVGQGTTMNTEKLSVYSENLIEKNNCQSCWAKYLCGGGCMAINKNQQGDKFKKDPHFCLRTRALLAEAIVQYGKVRFEHDSKTEDKTEDKKGA